MSITLVKGRSIISPDWVTLFMAKIIARTASAEMTINAGFLMMYLNSFPDRTQSALI